ncbi:MAG: hypothetical protein KAX46_02050, partial [Chromatiaceae bacterium]|nr:hypothetical protein [Chromatiaceae bacterium]
MIREPETWKVIRHRGRGVAARKFWHSRRVSPPVCAEGAHGAGSGRLVIREPETWKVIREPETWVELPRLVIQAP